MGRRPKEKRPENARIVAAWPRADIKFDDIERALGKDLNNDQKNELEMSLAFAVASGKPQQYGLSPNDAREFLDNVAKAALSLANLIKPVQPLPGHSRLLRLLQFQTFRDAEEELDLATVATNLRSVAGAAKTEAKRHRDRKPRIGRPRKNDNWATLILDLGQLFQSVHGKAPAITARGSTPGKFHAFVQAVFAELPNTGDRPTASALVPLIKRTLDAERANRRLSSK